MPGTPGTPGTPSTPGTLDRYTRSGLQRTRRTCQLCLEPSFGIFSKRPLNPESIAHFANDGEAEPQLTRSLGSPFVPAKSAVGIQSREHFLRRTRAVVADAQRKPSV